MQRVCVSAGNENIEFEYYVLLILMHFNNLCKVEIIISDEFQWILFGNYYSEILSEFVMNKYLCYVKCLKKEQIKILII